MFYSEFVFHAFLMADPCNFSLVGMMALKSLQGVSQNATNYLSLVEWSMQDTLTLPIPKFASIKNDTEYERINEEHT